MEEIAMAAAADTPTLRLVTSDGETIADSSTLQGLWTVEQYLRLTDHNTRLIEFADKRLEVLPVPTQRHQAIVKYLLLLLNAFLDIRGGTVFFAPLRLQIREGKFREPDLMAVRDANDPRLQNTYWLGADLVIEVVSEDDPQRDTVTKRFDYAEGAIPEYWIVNPLDETITVLKLEGQQYAEHGIFRRGDKATAALFEGLVVGVNEVFDTR
jgi:Uma2 family endonuclease